MHITRSMESVIDINSAAGGDITHTLQTECTSTSHDITCLCTNTLNPGKIALIF